MTWAREVGKCQVGEENENAMGGGGCRPWDTMPCPCSVWKG